MLKLLSLLHVWVSNINIYKIYLRSLGKYNCSHKLFKMHAATILCDITSNCYVNSEMWHANGSAIMPDNKLLAFTVNDGLL